MTEFEGVVPALAQALRTRGYTTLTPVQRAVLAPELKDADALVSAQTGSGKTVAFGLTLAPTLLEGAERFAHAPVPLALIVAPTRELALQVTRELEWLFEATGAAIASCVGGMDMRTERRALERGAHIVVGTPGRLCDHIKRRSFITTGLKAVVLDEADEMLDLGFREELETILEAAPTDRRTLMFSATVPRPIAALAKRYQRDAVRIATTEEQKQHLDIEYRALMVPSYERENAIINVLRFYEAKNALVFCATRATVNHMTSRLNNRGFSVVALSGELSQNERSHALQAMRDGRARVCVATDVAARGIDLPNLELVIHADMPKNPEILLHRSGRTGRAGRKGVCTLMVPNNARKRTDSLLAKANIQATWAKPPSVDEIVSRDHARVLDDPSFEGPISDEEQALAAELLAKHGPERVAAAFLRQHFAGRTAPEELLDSAPDQPGWSPVGGPERTREPRQRNTKERVDFKGGVWFSLSVGHKQKAEARWLLPMLCRAGDITNSEIGAIRIHNNESHVELKPGCVDGFLESVGATGVLEKGVTLSRLDGIPAMPAESKTVRAKKPYEKKTYDKKPYEKKPYEKKPYEKKPYEKKPYEKKPWTKKTTGEKPEFKKPEATKPHATKPEARKPAADDAWRKDPRAGKPKPKKKYKPGKPSAGGKPGADGKPGGSSPLKRAPKKHRGK
ncbi:MAG: DEAD/DEAH box helicase [Rhodospirillaceae bacterium]|nr:DEAD/DEAH box helicase [Rhodospirillaceae bacterium]